eukprot:scaffold23380_cov29-Tisochrysis_lutea.AAC.2
MGVEPSKRAPKARNMMTPATQMVVPVWRRARTTASRGEKPWWCGRYGEGAKAPCFEHARLVDEYRHAKGDDKHPNQAEHGANRHEERPEREAEDAHDDDERRADDTRQRGEGGRRAIHLLLGHPGEVNLAHHDGLMREARVGHPTLACVESDA